MATSMGPPPPREPNITTTTSNSDPGPPAESQAKTLDKIPPSPSAPMRTPMGPPPPLKPNPPVIDSLELQTETHEDEPKENHPQQSDPPPTEVATENSNSGEMKNEVMQNRKQEQDQNVSVPYEIPAWSEPPDHKFFLEVLKDGSIIDQFDVTKKGAYMFGRVDLCDFVLEHPTISRFHAVLQFGRKRDVYLYDLGSTHGTFINKKQVKKKIYVPLHVGDVIRFGNSSRLYIFQGPSELMPPERDMEGIRNAKIQEEMQVMEASLSRAKLEASLADGISWGMSEDAIEETEDDIEEITWQTHKGPLTEKQEKTRDKVIKRLEKIANMKKEIDAIRSKDISQGGLTQGQQTQIARNEQRMSQIMEELENLEETLNESIRESLGARAGMISHNKKKGSAEDGDEEYTSDDDDFYDRTKKKSSKQKGGDNQSIETSDSLLNKKEAIIKEMEEKKKLLLDEEMRLVAENEVVSEAGDALDVYMSGLSSQLVLDTKGWLEKEMSGLQSELDRVLYLLKIADPTGEAAKKRESRAPEPKPNISKIAASVVAQKRPAEQNKECVSEQTVSGTSRNLGPSVDMIGSSKEAKEPESVAEATESKTKVYTVTKPQWLGAVGDLKTKETKQESVSNMQECDSFVDYKDRNEILGKSNDGTLAGVVSGIENAAPGLILRKRKHSEPPDVNEVKHSEPSPPSAEDAVALLLKHSRGYYASDAEATHDNEDMPYQGQSAKDGKSSKKVHGPERPSFLETEMDYESWVPPEGQSGDGRTSLNERLGY